MVTEKVLVSAPGKVLIAGGYLVLDRAFSGLVVGIDSRFYTSVSSRSVQSPDSSSLDNNDTKGSPSTTTFTSEKNAKRVITVRSPQFKDGLWEYEVLLQPYEEGLESSCHIRPLKYIFITSCKHILTNLRYRQHQATNPYVEYAISHSLSLSSFLLGSNFESFLASGLDIVILGDNDFYSQREQV